MKLKDVIKTILITIFLTALCLLCYAKHNDFSSATEVYEVFIDGKEIGYLLDDNKLYELINNKQLEIKEKYKVSKVYPPENFKIIKTSSHAIHRFLNISGIRQNIIITRGIIYIVLLHFSFASNFQ